MPTPNAIYSNAQQSSAAFPGISGISVSKADVVESVYNNNSNSSVKETSTPLFRDLYSHLNPQQHQQQYEQQQQHPHGHQSMHSSYSLQHLQGFTHSHGHAHGRGRTPTHSTQPGPDPAVMEFISKIGQIIVKARTTSPPISFEQPSPSLSNSAGSASDMVQNSHYHTVLLQQQNLELVLQDMDLWRNNTPVHINIFHAAQHALLERWVISYTPATGSTSGLMACTADSARGSKSSYTSYHSPKANKHLQTQSTRSSPSASGSSSPSTSASVPPKDTTDLILLLQSLYTQIRSLPLQNCLTAFGEPKAKLTKADLAYSATSAHEDITLSRHGRGYHSQITDDDAPITDPSENLYSGFTSSLKSDLPLEFVQTASLKVINFEASHMQWGCVRVTGMYDESVGGRISPEHFQDSIKIHKKKHRHSRSKSSLSGSSLEFKATAKRQQQQQQQQQKESIEPSSWASECQPIKEDISVFRHSDRNSAITPFSELQRTLARTSSSEQHQEQQQSSSDGLKINDTIALPSLSSISQQQRQDLPSSPSSPKSNPSSVSEDLFRAPLESLKRNSDKLFSSLASSLSTTTALPKNPVKDSEQGKTLHESVLEESPIPKQSDGAESMTKRQEQQIQTFQFPPPPSPPLLIPLPRKTSVSAGEDPSTTTPLSPPSFDSGLSKTPIHSGFAPFSNRFHSQHSPPYIHPTPFSYQYSHSPSPTSPLARVVTRRRSSRLSIVMTCNDDSPGATAKPQSPLAAADDNDDSQDGDASPPPNSAILQFRRRSSLQEQNHASKPPLGQSPTRSQFLRRSSLNPTLSSSFNHSDLFGSLVGSYEESILSGRMSTLPSKPLIFTAQIGVLANQDYKDCPPKLRCPKHVQLEFPAVFYDYESSFNGGHNSHHNHSHSHSHQLHHSHSFHSKGAHSYSHHYPPISPSSHHHPLSGSSYSSSPALNSYFSSAMNNSGSKPGSFPSSHHHHHHHHHHNHQTLTHAHTTAILTAQDEPILPYVGNLDLDSGFRGSKRFARMPGGMRIPLRGQVQVMIKNPNKTVVKVFLVPYDFTDMPAGTKTFLRQKYYLMGSPGLGVASATASAVVNPNSGSGNQNSNNGNNSSSGTLRYAIHLQFCCPAPGYVYLYRSIRVVFANRVPDGKENLRVVLEGLGMGSRTIAGDTGAATSTTSTAAFTTSTTPSSTSTPTPRKLEERYVKMRKGEVMFCASKRKKEKELELEPEMSMTMSMSMDGELLPLISQPPASSPALASIPRGLGLGLGLRFESNNHLSMHPHDAPYSDSNESNNNNSSSPFQHTRHQHQYNQHLPEQILDFNGQPLPSNNVSNAPYHTGIDIGQSMGIVNKSQSMDASTFEISDLSRSGSAGPFMMPSTLTAATTTNATNAATVAGESRRGTVSGCGSGSGFGSVNSLNMEKIDGDGAIGYYRMSPLSNGGSTLVKSPEMSPCLKHKPISMPMPIPMAGSSTSSLSSPILTSSHSTSAVSSPLALPLTSPILTAATTTASTSTSTVAAAAAAYLAIGRKDKSQIIGI
ncbi:hypothetical protein BX616_004829 [Lobosporangium transversale]|uniref:Atos-like conserved domain-containing protein n=1 Tax=Lobosporangium transversale TaxID=64571 RepID=A0A1Y2GWD6_9FUNG|nr:hypothetical protein BCR41DRAFT_393195 [Lobosporangium transversale]KAF9916016.1 hypothetical protein BX616_004829 [Lobosporangium transversale]ORZ26579.1 hypothetical protein BCR41DRAFT_393195 [Lobosporangium transversale]|eukprot:XP_021884342.1 hypothetical protein BCR41DRAFT_393195 [Lobosporangium transversale]